MYIGSQWKTPIKMNHLRVYTPFSSISETIIYPPHNSTGAFPSQALVDRLSHDGRQRRGHGRPDLRGRAGAQRHTGHVGGGDRHSALGKTWYNDNTPQL